MIKANEETWIKGLIQSELNRVHTAIPGVVIAVRGNLQTQEIDVQPTINQKMSDGSIKPRPAVYGVPVIFPSSKTSSLTFPINVGDNVELNFSMRSLEAWKLSNGQPTTPANKGKFDKSDCWATPGLSPASEAVNNPSKHVWPHDTKDTVLVHNLGTGNEVEIRMKPTGDIYINTNQNAFVKCDNADITAQNDVDVTCTNASVTASNNLELSSASGSWATDTLAVFCPETTFFGNITLNGNYTQLGVMTLNGTVVNTHTHQNQVPPMGT